jgi:hypothetical protein
MDSLNFYYDLCKIDMCNNQVQSKYPYRIKESAVFTQHELVLNYKQNYCQNINIMTVDKEHNGGNGNDMSMSYYLYNDVE